MSTNQRSVVVEVLDAMCGTGKSYNLFKFITNNPNERYLYVTPMLTEVDTRPAEELAKFDDVGVYFDVPTGDGYATKGEHLVDLLSKKKHVSCSHALLQNMNLVGRQLIDKYEYTLIIDEELGMIEPLGEEILKSQDRAQLLRDGFITTESDGKVIWNAENEWGVGDSAFSLARRMAEGGSLYSTKNGKFFNVQLPVDLISAAKRVIVATYLFEGSVLASFLKVKGIATTAFTFPEMELRSEEILKKALQERIEIFSTDHPTTRKLLQAFNVPIDDLKAKRRNSTFSNSWYLAARKTDIDLLGKYARNVARRMAVTPDKFQFTIPSNIAGKRGNKWAKSGAKIIKVKGYSSENCFLHKSARATNAYSHKTAAIHMYNRYAHPAVTQYLAEQGAPIDQDRFALAELIQWLFRTAIRVPNGPKVKINIASPRMEHLFLGWLYGDDYRDVLG